MKLTLHPGSAIAGAVLVAAPFLLMSAQTEIAWPRHVPIPVSVQELPTPQDMVVLREEDGPYTVPEGKLFVLTAFGATATATPLLDVDGVREIKSNYALEPLALGFTVEAGAVITMDSQTSGAQSRAWGYLVDA